MPMSLESDTSVQPLTNLVGGEQFRCNWLLGLEMTNLITPNLGPAPTKGTQLWHLVCQPSLLEWACSSQCPSRGLAATLVEAALPSPGLSC